MQSRRIFKSATTSQHEVRELFQFVFLGELLNPGRATWLVSPWISDVPILDNRSGAFNLVEPDWGSREITISEMLLSLMRRGQPVSIATRSLDHNKRFLSTMREKARNSGVDSKLWINDGADALHTKGLLTDRALLSGSMNFTYGGFELNDEVISFDVELQQIAEARLNFDRYRNG
ncbi:phospholipase D-like domain-containing protein DpdK [Paraburkholderia sp. 40]|jgi:hypothetical protein|uniref:phospholipase D-like domain-containing protein DpdK n=1 Tax=Paraburkholderia sp. 40 TaxID=2991059 RepID=UPI003D2073C5